MTDCVGKYRTVRWFFVGDVSAVAELWGFYGDATARKAVVLAQSLTRPAPTSAAMSRYAARSSR